MEERGSVLARRSLLVIGILVVLAGLYILSSPVDANDFEDATGVAWSAFEVANPEPASYLEREARLLAVSFAGLGIVAVSLATTLLKSGDRTAWNLTWFLPLTLAGAAAVFLVSGAGGLGGFYGVAAVASGVVVLIGVRSAG